MKTLTRALFVVIVFACSVQAKTPSFLKKLDLSSMKSFPIRPIDQEGKSSSVPSDKQGFPIDPLSALVVAPNADELGVSSHYYLQTNGRSLHNVVIDPDNASNVHAVITATADNSPADSIGG